MQNLLTHFYFNHVIFPHVIVIFVLYRTHYSVRLIIALHFTKSPFRLVISTFIFIILSSKLGDQCKFYYSLYLNLRRTS